MVCGQHNFLINTIKDFHIAFTHTHDGKPIRSKMVHRPCEAERSIFVPVDNSLRMAVMVPNHKKPHNHPIPTTTKASYDAKALYRDSITVTGVLGATVRKVDNGKEILYSLDRLEVSTH